ncbi:filamentous hemagglutinin N-terminal domain-containing protein [Luteimonas sp. MC1825]|uniref:two-partner secretion domain-containing protein n=2 Tax=Luteimonas sp. MC1825 TaxID=2761107 RepID=UPI001619FA9E|nr:filamentous hemagglutinin N-terminal domain-containing protein [Luteimonas sp. MC1825]MBB6600280.1 filamentous hemagglutinin N-terminal domain-containing protein [Luteimonas sp. MC1825]QOC87962.1 filamentous hemagglutinin N-terminal domain-containing protein [Luteimonas sp. MC1825]
MHLAHASIQARRATPARARRPVTGRGLGAMSLHALSGAVLLALAASAHAAPPSGGVVTTGAANIDQQGGNMVITQTTRNVSINWQDFGIAAGESVQFVQPGVDSIALNRVLGSDPSVILGNLSSNGRVFLLNPNGILFGQGASVNVGGLVATTMRLSDADFQAGNHAFSNAGAGAVVNQGSITAHDGGHVALMGQRVSNDGVIVARLGTVALAAGEAVTLDVAGDGLLNVAVSTGAVNALAENGGMIRADGGRVLMTAQAAGNLLHTTVNNTGIIQAQSIGNRGGTIVLLGDMQSGTVNLGGTLDASAPGGGNGGFIETSAATVNVDGGVRVTTAAPLGQTGRWLIDPQDFTIGSAPGDNIAGSTLSAQLVTTNVEISTVGGGTGNGDIFVNDAVSWTASGAPTTLTLTANRNVDINAAITATNGNLAVCCGQDVNVNAAITTTNGSVLLAAGRDVNQFADITVTDGNLMMCAANDVNVAGAITLTRGTDDPTRSLGLARGLTLSADTDGTGPGIEGGTVVFDSLAPPATVTAAPVAIYYNPVSYTAPTDYSTRFTLTEGAALRQYMLVFATGGDRPYDGTTATTLTGLKGNPDGVILVAGPDAAADFDSPEEGTGGITYSGYTLGGPNAGAYALAVNCCGTVAAHTTGTITPAPTTPPPTTPPPTTPPPTTPPPTTPPPTAPPPTTPPPTVPPPGTPLVPPPTREPIFAPTPRPRLPLAPPDNPTPGVTDEQPTQTLVETPPVEVPVYVAPVRVPKPYRN